MYDTDEKHVGHFERPIGCLSCWCGCCSQTMRINFPPTKFMGEVIQKWSLFGSPNYQWVDRLYRKKINSNNLLLEFKITNATSSLCCRGETCAALKRFACSTAPYVDIYISWVLIAYWFSFQAAKIGKLKSEWDGLPDNKFASQQCFGLVFPKDLDLEHKNLLIGAAFLMVSWFFPIFNFF